jgi:hypothetical protein
VDLEERGRVTGL